jgi:L-alanine-DL-glutamate epimerase-like enolase superfamily enzyme
VSVHRRLSVLRESWPLRQSFRIARGTKSAAEVVVAEIAQGDAVGRGEAVPYARYGERVELVLEAIRGLSQDIASGMSRTELSDALGPGAARNALDCALWDLESQLADKPVWSLAALAEPVALVSAYTNSLEGDPEVEARAHAALPLLKLKLDGQDDAARVTAVRRGAPRAQLIVDANEAWSAESWLERATELASLGVALIEQPLAADDDSALAEHPHPVPIAADESCHDAATLPSLVGRYDVANIKLDKTGGLSEALVVRARAIELGLKVMVGCMCSTSLSLAPAMLLGPGAAFVDLDAGLLLARDRAGGVIYRGSEMQASPRLWGLAIR